MPKLIDGAPQGGEKEVRKNIVPADKIQKVNDNDAADHTWIYPDSLRRRIKVAIAKKLKPEDLLEEIVKTAEKEPSDNNKALLIQVTNELGRHPENENLVKGLLVSERFKNLILKGVR